MKESDLKKLKGLDSIDVYIASDFSERHPSHPGSFHHYTVYSNGHVYTTGHGPRSEMVQHMGNDYCTSLIWLRSIFYDE